MVACINCTSNRFLKAWVQDQGTPGFCELCNADTRHSIDLQLLLKRIDAVIRDNYSPHLDEGTPAHEVIAKVAGVSERVARLVTNVVGAEEAEGASFYDFGPLVKSEQLSFEHITRWSRLKKSLTQETRYLGTNALPELDALLGGLDTFCNGAAIRELGTGCSLFRARLAQTPKQATEWCAHPEIHLVAPRERITAGRMNPAGIRVFYGALSEKIAVAELRPWLGAEVVVAKFRPRRPLRVLDLGSLGEPMDYEDIFNSAYKEVSQRLCFLAMLEQEISLPVRPHEQDLDYVPTQLIAEYIRIVLGLDGIAYRSAQVDGAPYPGQFWGQKLEVHERNIALFGPAANTERDVISGAAADLLIEPGRPRIVQVCKIELEYRPNRFEEPGEETDNEDGNSGG